MFNTYAVISCNKKYHGSFVLEDGNKQREEVMKKYFEKALNKNTVQIVKCHSTNSRSLATNVCGGIHKVIVEDSLLINTNNPEEVRVANIVSECIDKISNKNFSTAKSKSKFK